MVKVSLSQISILICFVIISCIIFSNKYWRDENKIINSDVINYYGYLPAIFIYQDASLEFWDNAQPEVQQRIWYQTNEESERTFKMSMGVSYFYLPFFVLAHQLSNQLGYQNNGYSLPYRAAIVFSSLLFYVLGLLFLRKVLLNYFNELVAAITILIVGIGTNIINYITFEPGMSHVFSFFSIAVFFYYSIKWYRNQTSKGLFILGALCGLIMLIRPINITVLLFFLLMDVSSLTDLKKRVLLFLTHYKQVVFAIIGGLIVVMPQLLYWKYNTGDWFYYSYSEEGFFFNDPKIIEGLFSFRKGWLIYTPLMSLAFIGLFFKNDLVRKYRFSFLVFLSIHFYITFSWWCWWYGGSFGMRTLIDIYPLLIVPIGVVVACLSELSNKFRIPFFSILLFLIVLNFFQRQQYVNGSLHFDAMSLPAYIENFGKLEVEDAKYYDLLDMPDYEKAMKGER